jgi:HD-like signal output (HDOD) protein
VVPHDDSLRPLPTLQDLAATYRELPTMPATVADVLQQLSSPDWTIGGIEDTIARDPALVARMISVSNSALYGGGQEFRTLNQALVRLGYRAIRSLAVVAAARALFPLEDARIGTWGQALWRHSAACGWAARMVAERAGLDDPDDSFAAGALHDIGKVVIMLNRPDDYARILPLLDGGQGDSRAAESAVLGVDHTVIATWLMANWNLPEGVVRSVAGHHDPDAVDGHERQARVVACGDILAHIFAGGPLDLRTSLYGELARLGLKLPVAEELGVEVLSQLADLGDLV